MIKTCSSAYFTRKMFASSVMASPLAAVGLALAAMGDAILSGHALGVTGLAAIGFISPLFLLASFFMFGLSTGGAIVYGNLMHEGKKEEALGIFTLFLRISALTGFAIAAGGLLFQDGLLVLLGASPEDGVVYDMAKSYQFYILLGIPFEILMGVLTAYLRNDDADMLSVIIQSASGILNLAVSALLLLVFDWGVAGCGFGFFFSNFCAVVFSITYILFRRNGELSFRARAGSLRVAIKPLRLGFATSSEYIFDALFTLAAIHLLMDIAGTEGVAVFNIVENLSLLFIFLYEFIGKTSQPLFSTFFSECNYCELHRTLLYALAYSLFWGAVSTVLVVLYPQILDLLFGMEGISDTSMAYYAARIFCIGSIFMGCSLLMQNYLQSEEDEKGAFLVVFLRRPGISLPLVFGLSMFGYHAFWLVYPLSEILTLVILYLYKRRKGENRNVEAERVFCTSFVNTPDLLAEQLNAIDAFADSWGAGNKKLYALRMAVEDICGVTGDAAERENRAAPLTQLTLIAREDGTFKLHLRNNGKELDPFRLSGKDLPPLPQQPESMDFRVLGLHAAKTYVHQFLYRKYQGFNTMRLTV